MDQYLCFVEFQAKQRKAMHLADWVRKLDEFFRLNDRDILEHAGRMTTKLGDEIAEREWDKYFMKQKAIEAASNSVSTLIGISGRSR